MNDDDPLLVWSAQDGRPGTRTWRHGYAVAVSYPALSRRDRITVAGSPGDAVELLRAALPVLGRHHRGR